MATQRKPHEKVIDDEIEILDEEQQNAIIEELETDAAFHERLFRV